MKLTAVPRITLGLVSIGMGLLLVFDLLLHVFPREADLARQSRTQLANTLSIQAAVLVQARDLRSVDRTLAAVRALDPEVESIGLRKADGMLLSQAGDHAQHWAAGAAIDGSLNELSVAIMSERRRWGTLELRFRPVYRRAISDWLASGPTQLLALFSLSAGLLYFVYLRRMLQHLDPSGAVPERVRGAFDALTEGVLIVDTKEHVLLANCSFLALSPESMRSGLIGRKASGLTWLQPTEADATPWMTTMRTRQAVQGRPFRIAGDHTAAAKVVLNCSPLLDEQKQVRGCLITIDDVTELERSHDQLMEVLADLATSKEQLELKNIELENLANCDALSGCLNRRAFFVGLERLFRQASAQGGELYCIMADIDHFKSINDRFGHGVGDEAIQAFAEVLRGCAQPGDTRRTLRRRGVLRRRARRHAGACAAARRDDAPAARRGAQRRQQRRPARAHDVELRRFLDPPRRDFGGRAGRPRRPRDVRRQARRTQPGGGVRPGRAGERSRRRGGVMRSRQTQRRMDRRHGRDHLAARRPPCCTKPPRRRRPRRGMA